VYKLGNIWIRFVHKLGQIWGPFSSYLTLGAQRTVGPSVAPGVYGGLAPVLHLFIQVVSSSHIGVIFLNGFFKAFVNRIVQIKHKSKECLLIFQDPHVKIHCNQGMFKVVLARLTRQYITQRQKIIVIIMLVNIRWIFRICGCNHM